MTQGPPEPESRGRRLGVLAPLAFVAGWIALQAWVLPRAGVPT